MLLVARRMLLRIVEKAARQVSREANLKRTFFKQPLIFQNFTIFLYGTIICCFVTSST